MTERVPSLLRDVGIPEEFLFRYPTSSPAGNARG